MERALVFAVVRIGIDAVVEPDWTDWKFIAEAAADRVTHIIESNIFRGRQQVAGVEEYRALQFAVDGEGVFAVEDRLEFAADGITVHEGPEVTLAEAANGCRSSIEESLVDRNGRLLV